MLGIRHRGTSTLTDAFSLLTAEKSFQVVIQMTTFTQWYQFAIGRLIAGFGVGALSVSCSIGKHR